MTSVPPQFIPYPTTDDRAVWRAYWEAQGQQWRTEPEIEKKLSVCLGNNVMHVLYIFTADAH